MVPAVVLSSNLTKSKVTSIPQELLLKLKLERGVLNAAGSVGNLMVGNGIFESVSQQNPLIEGMPVLVVPITKR